MLASCRIDGLASSSLSAMSGSKANGAKAGGLFIRSESAPVKFTESLRKSVIATITEPYERSAGPSR